MWFTISLVVIVFQPFQVILAVYPRMDWPEQEKLLLYAHSKSCHLMQDTSTDSLFFNPLSLKQDRESFHQELVETFNKLVTSSERGRLAAGILKAALVMPVVLLSMMVEEAMKTGAHVKAMYQVGLSLFADRQGRFCSPGPSLHGGLTPKFKNYILPNFSR